VKGEEVCFRYHACALRKGRLRIDGPGWGERGLRGKGVAERLLIGIRTKMSVFAVGIFIDDKGTF
jgi:hypothetical protein